MSQGLPIRTSALNFLARREYGSKELIIKLVKKYGNAKKPEIEELILQLQTEQLVSDERYTELFIRNQLNKGVGPNKIIYALNLLLSDLY